MRILFLFLLLANLGFYTYAHYMRPAADGGGDLQKLQVAPEKIRLLKISETPQQAAVPAAAACLEWGGFSAASAAKADAVIAELALAEAQVQRVTAESPGYWVYVPPTKTRAAADKNIARLKESGVTDFALVLEQSQWRLAVSLGSFKSEDAARKMLAAVRGKGIDDAVLERRENLFRQIVFYFREPGEAAVAKLAAARAAMPESEIRAVTCPAAATG